VLVFTSEEIWKHFPKAKGDQPSVHMSLFPAEQELRAGTDAKSMSDWERLYSFRSEVLQDLERARNQKSINSSLEAKVKLRSNGSLFELLQKHLKELPALLIVSQVEVLPFDGPVNSDHPEPFHVEILHADGIKCERCWNYSTHVGENTRYPTICERCSEALAEIEGAPAHATP
jgi:isoleucyl-tRNA synthetase